MTSEAKTVAIIGAGVMGLSIGWRLAQAGFKVQVFEEGLANRQASWAAAGMIAAAAETAPGQETFFALARASREDWPGFASDLETASGHGIAFLPGETLVVAQSQEHENHLRDTVKYLRQFDEPVRLIKKARLPEVEPEVSPDARLGLLSAHDGQVDNRILGTALCEALRREGGELFENTPVEDIVLESARAVGVKVAGEIIPADHVILCAGSWSSTSFPSSQEIVPQVHPIKGQMIAFQSDPGRLTRVVWGQGVYIVPRADGRIIIGATTEDTGFDLSTDQPTLEAQKAKAAAVVPFLGDLEIIDSWAGLRPATPDNLPIMGPSDIEGLTLATGHYRNGILLAPITAALIAEYIQSDQVPAGLIPFAPQRFSPSR